MLGHWDPIRAVPLTTTKETYPMWTIKLDMPRDKIIEYKFLIIKSPGLKKPGDIKENIIWENLPQGINRLISTHGKKELMISEEMDNTQSTEEYVEIIAAPHMNFSSYGILETDPHLLMHLNNQPHSHHHPDDPHHFFKEDENLDNLGDRCTLNRPRHLYAGGERSKIDEDSDEDIGYRESDEEEPLREEIIKPVQLKYNNSAQNPILEHRLTAANLAKYQVSYPLPKQQ